MSILVQCPSGLAGEIRGIKAKLFADRTLSKSGAVMDRLLQSCWLETIDPGVYDFTDEASPDWSKVLVGDRFYALLQIRRATFGDEYAFSVQCQSVGCRRRFEWELCLDDLPVRALSAEARATFQQGNRFEIVLPRSGRRAWFRLLTGAEEARAATLRRQERDDHLIDAVDLRIVEIEGVAEKDRRRFLEEMELADLTRLLDASDEVDCGVETGIEVECPRCGDVQDIELPFARGFFLPRARTRAMS